MKLIDVNLLLYAYDLSSPFHAIAKRWLEESLSSGEPVRLAWQGVLAFVRIVTHPRTANPIGLSQAIAIVDDWLNHPSLEILEPGEQHWLVLRSLLNASQARGPLVMDAELAALAIEHGATLCSNDRDFARFSSLRWQNPLE
ncbi:MAG: TA system VapC family ribonuclease toxin [Bryobacteraceae bacterium]